MARKSSKYLVAAIVVLLVGLSVFLLINNMKLKNENADLKIQVEKTDQKAEAIKKKYTEEKALATSMQRAKMATDSQMRTIESELEALEEKIGELTGSRDALEMELRKKEESFKHAMEDRQKAYDELKEQLEASAKALSSAEETIRRKKEELAELTNDNADLEVRLEEALSKIDRVVGHNKKLVELSMSLLAKFDDRNVFQSLMEKEPFTQAKRIELEKMIQEYIDLIEEDTLSDSDI